MLDSVRKSRPAIALGLLLLIAGLLATLHWYRPPQSGLWIRVFLESMHVVLFGLVAIASFALLTIASLRHLWLRIILAILFASLLGAVSEIVQISGPRDASVEDFELDLIGATAGILILLGYSKTWLTSLRVRRALLVGGLALAVFGMWPLVVMSAAYLERNHQRPVILSFDSRLGGHFRLMQNATLTVVPDDNDNISFGRIRLKDAPWPAIILHDIWPNWEGYSNLVIDMELPGKSPLNLNIRIHDLEHRSGDQPYSDRFNRSFSLQPGPNRLSIRLSEVQEAPRTRKIDLSEIDGIVIFGSHQDAGMEFMLRQISLE